MAVGRGHEEKGLLGALAAPACAGQGPGGDTEGLQQLWNLAGAWPVATVMSQGTLSMTLYHRGVIQQLSRNARI